MTYKLKTIVASVSLGNILLISFHKCFLNRCFKYCNLYKNILTISSHYLRKERVHTHTRARTYIIHLLLTGTALQQSTITVVDFLSFPSASSYARSTITKTFRILQQSTMFLLATKVFRSEMFIYWLSSYVTELIYFFYRYSL